ncbi:MAG: sulfurase [Marmoricola sp.]|nr:sulfurase [Marmoricola sp.]
MSPSEPDVPTVVALHVAPARRAGTEQVDAVEVEAGAGIVGDRYHGTRHRHVSVQSATALADAAADLGAPVEPGATRRNVTLSHGEVPTEPGARLRIGPVLLEVVRIAAPCAVLDVSVGPGARAALRRRGGSICRVLEGGPLRVGDAAVLPDLRPPAH